MDTIDYFKEETNEVTIECFKCGECGYSTSSKDDLKQHKVNQHIFTAVFGFIEADNDEGELEQDDIENVFKKLRRKQKEGKHECDKCGFKTDHKQTLKNHVASIHKGVIRYQCSECDYRNYYKQNLKYHISKNHKEAKIIEIGGESKEKCKNSNPAKKKRLKGQPFSQNVPKRFPRKSKREQINQRYEEYIEYPDSEIKQEIRKELKHEINEPKMYPRKFKGGGELQCEECDFSSDCKQTFKKHVDVVHRKIFKYSCSLCDYKSFYKHAVQSHMKGKHKDISGKIMKTDCKKCKKDEFHEKCESTKKNKKGFLTCDECDFSTDRKNAFRNHMASIHEGIVRFQCSECDYKSYFKNYLKNHIRKNHKDVEAKIVQIGEESKETPDMGQPKKFKCDECNFSSNIKPNLTKHVASVHQNVYNFSCSLCEYKSFSKNSVRIHLQRIHRGQNGVILKADCGKCKTGELHEKCEEANPNEKSGRKCIGVKFRCEDCDYSTDNKYSYKLHKATNHQYFFYRCSLCDYRSCKKNTLKDHLQNEHENILGKILHIDCVKCQKDEVHEKCEDSNPENASNKRQRGGKHKCEECYYSTDWKHDLNTHVATIHLGIARFMCSVCEYKSHKKTCMGNHIRRRHQGIDAEIIRTGPVKEKGKHQCTECEYSTNIKHNLSGHMDTVHLGIVNFVCSICAYKSYQKHNMLDHIRKHHQGLDVKIIKTGPLKEKGKHQCKECEYSTNLARHLKTHISSKHLGVLRFQCSLCKHKTYHKISLERHIKKFHKGEEALIEKIQEKRKHQCAVCTYSTNFALCLKNHISSKHEKISRYKCSQCQHKTYYKASLKKHIKNKHEEGEAMIENIQSEYCQEIENRNNVVKYQCSLCEYKDFHKNNLKAHIITHHREEEASCLKIGCPDCSAGKECEKCKTGDKKIKCSECDLTFKNGRARFKHFKESHPGKNIYQCAHCDYGSNYLPNLNNHVDSMHEKKTLACDKCDFITTWNQLFHQHMRWEHGVHQKKSSSHGKTFLCDSCAFTTIHKTKFDNHNATVHNRGKRFQCYQCQHSTFFKYEIRNHIIKTHPGTDITIKPISQANVNNIQEESKSRKAYSWSALAIEILETSLKNGAKPKAILRNLRDQDAFGQMEEPSPFCLYNKVKTMKKALKLSENFEKTH